MVEEAARKNGLTYPLYVVGCLGVWLLLIGCTSTPTALQPTSDHHVRLSAELVAPETLAEALQDEQAAQHITAVELHLQNAGPTPFTFAPSRAALVGPRHQLILALDPSELSKYARGPLPWGGLSTPPYAAAQQRPSNPIARKASDKAPRAQVLVPGDVSQGWLYFPVAVERASEDLPRRWLLAVVLQDQEQRVREVRVRVEPPGEASP
jgi:hypothetical protein